MFSKIISLPPELILFAGPNGHGKTSLANKCLQKYPIPFINADNIYLTPNFNGSIFKAGIIAINATDALINTDSNLVLESTLSGKNYYNKIFAKMINRGYIISIIYVILHNLPESLKRIQYRVSQGGHDIPTEDVYRRFRKAKQNFWQNFRPQADNWIMVDNQQEQPKIVICHESEKGKKSKFFEGFKQTISSLPPRYYMD